MSRVRARGVLESATKAWPRTAGSQEARQACGRLAQACFDDPSGTVQRASGLAALIPSPSGGVRGDAAPVGRGHSLSASAAPALTPAPRLRLCVRGRGAQGSPAGRRLPRRESVSRAVGDEPRTEEVFISVVAPVWCLPGTTASVRVCGRDFGRAGRAVQGWTSTDSRWRVFGRRPGSVRGAQASRPRGCLSDPRTETEEWRI